MNISVEISMKHDAVVRGEGQFHGKRHEGSSSFLKIGRGWIQKGFLAFQRAHPCFRLTQWTVELLFNEQIQHLGKALRILNGKQ